MINKTHMSEHQCGLWLHLCDGVVLVLPDLLGLGALSLVQDGRVGRLLTLTGSSQFGDQTPQTGLPSQHSWDGISYTHMKHEVNRRSCMDMAVNMIAVS